MQRRALVPVSVPANAGLSVNELTSRVSLLVAYTVYVLSNALELQSVVPVDAKHATFALIAVLALVRHPMQSARAIAVALPIALVYVLGGLPLYGGMVLVFAASLPILSEAIRSIVSEKRRLFLLSMLLISMVPALLSLPTLIDEGLLDTTYGRERVLLGYWHPKEAGVSFAIPILLAMVSTRLGMAVPLAAAAFLWLVGSRNNALLVLLAYALHRQARWTMATLLAATLALVTWVLSNNDWYEIADTIVSLRLSVWSEALGMQQATTQLDVLSGERFGTDNFFVEAFVMAGGLSVPLLATWLAAASYASTRASHLGNWPRVCLLLLLFFACFDSGVASTGNLMHAILWAVLLTPLFEHRKAPQRSPNRRRLSQIPATS